MISSWTSFAFLFFFFYIIGDVIAGWWHNAWWVFMILGFSLIGAISASIRFLFIGPRGLPEYQEERMEHISTNVEAKVISNSYTQGEQLQSKELSSAKYCKNCGTGINESGSFCPNCGEAL